MDIGSTRDVIGKLLTNIGSRNEVEQYLRHYASAAPEKFAIIEVSGEVLEADFDDVVSSLVFLHQVGLRPILVLGRIATDDLAAARQAYEAAGLRLAEALEALGTRARPIAGGVFRAELSGAVTETTTTSVMSAIRMTHLPILAPLGETAQGQIVHLAPEAGLPALAHAIQPHKIIYLGGGGLLDAGGRPISAVNLEEDEATIGGRLDEAGRARLRAVAALLRSLPRTTSVSMTSPDHLARELFTYRGAGTLIRLGERIASHASFATTDTDRLRALLEQSFGRKLDDDYFVKKQPLQIYLAESYRATAVLTRELDIPYLDKFAVTSEAQGEGVGGSLWERMRRDHARLFWRSRATNPINAWYMQKADGMIKAEQWTVFWYGVRDFAEIRACVEKALALPGSLRS